MCFSLFFAMFTDHIDPLCMINRTPIIQNELYQPPIIINCFALTLKLLSSWGYANGFCPVPSRFLLLRHLHGGTLAVMSK